MAAEEGKGGEARSARRAPRAGSGDGGLRVSFSTGAADVAPTPPSVDATPESMKGGGGGDGDDGTPLASVVEPFSPAVLSQRMRATSGGGGSSTGSAPTSSSPVTDSVTEMGRAVDAALAATEGGSPTGASTEGDTGASAPAGAGAGDSADGGDAGAARASGAGQDGGRAEAGAAARDDGDGDSASGAGAGSGGPDGAGDGERPARLSAGSGGGVDRRDSVVSATVSGDPRKVWTAHNKHVFVLSDAGKPVFSRYGDEYQQSAIMAVIQAVVSRSVDVGDSLRSIRTGDATCVFYTKGPLYLLIVSRSDEPPEALHAQLHFLYKCIVFFLSIRVLESLERNPSYDIRGQMGGTREALLGVVRSANRSLSIPLNAVPVLPLSPVMRAKVGVLVQSAKVPDLVYGLVLAGGYVVSIVQPKKATHALAPSDLLLLINFVRETSVRGSESWAPVCLPELADTGFLHAYIAYVTGDVSVILVSTKSTQEHFVAVSSAKDHLKRSLLGSPLLKEITKMHKQQRGVGVTVEGMEGLAHFAYKFDALGQFASMSYPRRFTEHAAKKKLLRRYLAVYYKLVNGASRVDAVYETTDFATLAAVKTDDGVLLASFDRLVTAGAAADRCENLVVLVRREREAFVCRPLTWPS